MARFRGYVGYNLGTVETSPGVWEDNVVERRYSGDVVRNTLNIQEGDKVNDDFTVSNSISIVADSYAMRHYSAIRYVKKAGALWKVTSIEEQSPRLLLRLGGVYDGPRPEASTP